MHISKQPPRVQYQSGLYTPQPYILPRSVSPRMPRRHTRTSRDAIPIPVAHIHALDTRRRRPSEPILIAAHTRADHLVRARPAPPCLLGARAVALLVLLRARDLADLGSGGGGGAGKQAEEREEQGEGEGLEVHRVCQARKVGAWWVLLERVGAVGAKREEVR